MKNDFKLIVSLLENTRFKVTIIMIVLLGFMTFGTITERMTFIEGIYNVMTWDYFIMVLLFLFMFNTYNIYTELTHNYSFMIRIKDYKEFFNKMIKFIFISPDELKMPKYIKDAIQEQGHAYYETDNLDEVIGSLDILYMTRVQRERFENQEQYEKLKNYYIHRKCKMLEKICLLCIHYQE